MHTKDTLRVPNTWAIQKPLDAPVQPRGALGLGPNPYDPRNHCGTQGPPILLAQHSRQAACVLGHSYGCYAGWPHAMWVAGGCRGTFRCSRLSENTVRCDSWSRADPGHKYCECAGVGTARAASSYLTRSEDAGRAGLSSSR